MKRRESASLFAGLLVLIDFTNEGKGKQGGSRAATLEKIWTRPSSFERVIAAGLGESSRGPKKHWGPSSMHRLLPAKVATRIYVRRRQIVGHFVMPSPIFVRRCVYAFFSFLVNIVPHQFHLLDIECHEEKSRQKEVIELVRTLMWL